MSEETVTNLRIVKKGECTSGDPGVWKPENGKGIAWIIDNLSWLGIGALVFGALIWALMHMSAICKENDARFRDPVQVQDKHGALSQ